MAQSDLLLMTTLFGGTDVLKSLDPDSPGEVEALDDGPLAKWIETNRLQKSAGTIDLESSWDSELYRSPRSVSAEFERRSKARLERVSEKFEQLFGSHPEATKDVVDEMAKVFAAERAAVV
jgi:hypothetical protein